MAVRGKAVVAVAVAVVKDDETDALWDVYDGCRLQEQPISSSGTFPILVC